MRRHQRDVEFDHLRCGIIFSALHPDSNLFSCSFVQQGNLHVGDARHLDAIEREQPIALLQPGAFGGAIIGDVFDDDVVIALF